ncbi:ribbon-helix-helix domain-containing protein [Aurantimonas sp. Leaf443]|uniref:ribbon-helix-helix domain-containing protein n=1 Tax=Aurantimonas sp. Leaf443 TaxID=1736378 RepID=UPI0032987161
MKRSLSIRGHRTSISVEDRFWERLRVIAAARGLPLAGLVAEIDGARDTATNLSSAIRLFVIDEALARASALEETARQGREPVAPAAEADEHQALPTPPTPPA